jgi:hypothetical protein
MSRFSEAGKTGAPTPDAEIHLGKYLPEDFDERSEDYREGFLEAVVKMVVEGRVVPDGEIN